MPKERTFKGQLGYLQRLLATLNANSGELPHLEVSREQLEALVAQALEAAGRQAVHAAIKQEATQQLNTSLVESLRLANVLRLAVKQHYGIRAEKLAEFGMQPFRGRPRKSATAPEPPPPPAETPKPSPSIN
jgi:hypothetical protein